MNMLECNIDVLTADDEEMYTISQLMRRCDYYLRFKTIRKEWAAKYLKGVRMEENLPVGGYNIRYTGGCLMHTYDFKEVTCMQYFPPAFPRRLLPT